MVMSWDSGFLLGNLLSQGYFDKNVEVKVNVIVCVRECFGYEIGLGNDVGQGGMYGIP